MDEGELLALLNGLRTTPIRVCRIDPYHARKIGAHTNIVWLSPETVAKQETRHKDRDLTLYRIAETVITKGELFRVCETSFVAIWTSPTDQNGKTKHYKSFVKANNAGGEIYLRSVHRTTEARIRNVRREHKPL